MNAMKLTRRCKYTYAAKYITYSNRSKIPDDIKPIRANWAYGQDAVLLSVFLFSNLSIRADVFANSKHLRFSINTSESKKIIRSFKKFINTLIDQPNCSSCVHQFTYKLTQKCEATYEKI